ncbi:reverse transcriptase, partial [Globisporangium splendens]
MRSIPTTPATGGHAGVDALRKTVLQPSSTPSVVPTDGLTMTPSADTSPPNEYVAASAALHTTKSEEATRGSTPCVVAPDQEATKNQGLVAQNTEEEEVHVVMYAKENQGSKLTCVVCPPQTTRAMVRLPKVSYKAFLRDLKRGEIEQIFPEELPLDRGVQHEIDLEPGSTHCVTRQWPLPKDQFCAIDGCFYGRLKSGHIPFNKLNDATIPAQTPTPRKDVILDSMSGFKVFIAIDLMDGFYQILMRKSDTPLTVISTPNGMLWEWLATSQALKNTLATFNRVVSQVLRPFRNFAPSYFDDIFVHSKAENSKSAGDVHTKQQRKAFQAVCDHRLCANIKKCVFFASEIPSLGCFTSKDVARGYPEKVIISVTSTCANEFEICGPDEQPIIAARDTVRVRHTRPAFEHVFPHALFDESLAQRFIGKEVVYMCRNANEFRDDSPHTVH